MQRDRNDRRDLGNTVGTRVVAFALAVLLCVPACNLFQSAGQNAAEEIHKTVDDALDSLPKLIQGADEAVTKALQTANGVLATQIAAARDALHAEIEALDATLNARIEQGDSVLKSRIDQINTALAARILQLTDFAQHFIDELDGVIQGTVKQLTYSADYLVSKTGRVGTDLIENAGFTVTRTVREGGKLVGYVTKSIIETVVVIAALALLLILIVLGLLYYRRLSDVPPPIRASQWVPGTVILCAFAPLAISGLVPSLRSRVTASRIELSDDPDAVCPPAIAKAHEFTRSYPHAVTDQAQKDARVVEEKLYVCLNSAIASDLRSQAIAILGDVHRALGETKPTCTRNEDCNVAAGEHCDVAHSTCTARCLVDADCAAGKVCGGAGKCVPPCSSFTQCEHGFVCKSGHCSLAPECSPTETKKCGISDRAPCRLGTMTCGDDGHWGGCVGSVDPTAQDACVPGNDSNCDGVPANGFATGGRSVCQCMLGAPDEVCDCPAACAGIKGTRQCLDEGHRLGGCLPCTCDCSPGAVDNNCSCAGSSPCNGRRTCNAGGRWDACNCPPPQCPPGFTVSGAACIWQGADFGYQGWSVTGTPEFSVFATIDPPAECNVTAHTDCVIHFRLRDRGGDCKHNTEESLEVSCQGTNKTITMNGGDVGNGVEWELPCKSRVLFKKLHSTYNWGTSGCIRYVDDPRFWRVTVPTQDKRCR